MPNLSFLLTEFTLTPSQLLGVTFAVTLSLYFAAARLRLRHRSASAPELD